MRRFQYGLRGLLVVTTMLAISFSLIRTGLHSDWWGKSYGGYVCPACLVVGVYLLAGTLGGSIGFLVAARKGAVFGTAGFLVLFWAFLFFFG